MGGFDLSGEWSGTYSGDPPDIPGNRFEARLVDSAGRLAGTIVEPDADAREGVLRADVRGTVSGAAVAFLKLYDGADHAAHGVDYRGVLSADGTLIAGEWAFAGYSGVFEMRRPAAQVRRRAAAAGERAPVG